ncbi:kelch-like protein 3 [Emydura macquarii macquarii]|uniref:kelch-like protein 3 n=1 Tax=Emydura macquarii macquarii TaxID=1129001 RepID=UPI00352B4578
MGFTGAWSDLEEDPVSSGPEMTHKDFSKRSPYRRYCPRGPKLTEEGARHDTQAGLAPVRRVPPRLISPLETLEPRPMAKVGDEDEPEATPGSLGRWVRQGFQELYQAQQLCDVTLVAAGRSFPSHRLVLGSVSPYLRDMMASEESQGRQVQLQGVSPSVLQSILNYLYTEELALTAERAQELFVVASRLQIPPLLETVGRFLMETISLESCLTLHALAQAHNHPALLQAARSYVSLNFRSLSEHDAFLHLAPGALISIISSDGLAVPSELAVYRAVGRWVRAAPAERLPLLRELLGHVRLPLLTPEELAEAQADVAELSGALRLRWKGAAGEGRLRASGGLRQGMYEEVIVCVGCAAGEGLASPLDCFDPRTETWEAPLGSVPVRFPGFAALGHKLYVAGGCGPDGGFSTRLHEYDACRGQWAELPSMSRPLDPHGFLVCGRRLYAVGGCAEAEGKLASAETFDLEQKRWAPASRLPFPLSYFASATLSDQLYLIGGKKHVGGAMAAHRGLLIYHVSSDTWEQVLLGVGLCHAGAAATAHGICVVGGCRDEGLGEDGKVASCPENFQASRVCFLLDEDGQMRQEVVIPALPRAIESAGAVCWQGRVYVVGGEDSARWLNTVYYWEPGATAWTLCREGPATMERVGWFGCVTLRIPVRPLRALFQEQPTAPAAVGVMGRQQLSSLEPRLPCRTSAAAAGSDLCLQSTAPEQLWVQTRGLHGPSCPDSH